MLLGGDRAFAGGRQSHSSFLVSLNTLSGLGGSIPHVGSKGNNVEVLVDVVHNLGLEEGLGSVIHDLVGELGPQILDNLELSSEEGVLSWVHGVIVGLEEGGVHSRNGFHEALEAG